MFNFTDIVPSTSLNKNILSILDKCCNLNHLKQLQSHFIILGHGHTPFYAFKLLRFCTIRLSNLIYARYIFDNLNLHNIYLYTAMITAYSSTSNHSSAVLLYCDMLRQNRSRPNHFVFPVILKSFPEVVTRYGVEMVHAQIEKHGFEQYPVVQTALFDVYSRYGGDLSVARKVFDEMSERDAVPWTAMISGYMRVGEIGNAVILFEKMPEGIRDTPFWNSVIAGCVQNGLYSEAIEFFRRMIVEEGIEGKNRPNQATLASALSACGHGGILQLGKCIHGYAYRNGLSMDSFLVNGLIDMYGKCGSLRQARMIFDGTSKTSLAFCNCMINCFALHGHSEGAISVFEEMLPHIRPDEVTFIGLLNACSHGGLVEAGRHYYDMMITECRIEPQIKHYGCLIDLLGRAGRFEEAMEVIKGMRIPPDEVVYCSLLNGCRIHRRADLAEIALKKLIEINPNNGGYFSILAIYGEVCKWDEVPNIREMLSKRNAYRTPGCSWIEVDNQIHQFNSADKSHYRTEEIHGVLECLVGAH